MFDDVGGKLKTIAKVFCWIGIVLSVIYGISIIAGLVKINGFVAFLMGLLVAAILSFVSWISSLGLYALGEILENSDHVKRTSQKQVDILEEIAREEVATLQTTANPATTLEEAEDERWLMQKLKQLPTTQHTILYMRQVERLSAQDIAQRLGISETSVSTLLSRARRSLLEEIKRRYSR